MTINSCGKGFNLFYANVIIFIGIHTTPKMMLQGEDRCHRKGQTKDTYVYWTYLDGSYDNLHYLKLNKKEGKSNLIIDGEDEEDKIEFDHILNLCSENENKEFTI